MTFLKGTIHDKIEKPMYGGVTALLGVFLPAGYWRVTGGNQWEGRMVSGWPIRGPESGLGQDTLPVGEERMSSCQVAVISLVIKGQYMSPIGFYIFFNYYFYLIPFYRMLLLVFIVLFKMFNVFEWICFTWYDLRRWKCCIHQIITARVTITRVWVTGHTGHNQEQHYHGGGAGAGHTHHHWSPAHRHSRWSYPVSIIFVQIISGSMIQFLRSTDPSRSSDCSRLLWPGVGAQLVSEP